MLLKLEAGEIAVDEYEDWTDRYNPSVFMGDNMEEEPDPYIYRGVQLEDAPVSHSSLTQPEPKMSPKI